MQDLRFHAFLKYGFVVAIWSLPFTIISGPSSIRPLDKFIIVIDAGHGGKDIGTAGSILIEKDATLNLALELGASLLFYNPNIEVRFTRDSDIFVPIHQRVGMANDLQADLFISVHCNAVKNHNPSGIETYVLGVQNNEENLETVKRENESILHEADFRQKYDGFDPHSPSGHIFLSAIQNKFMNEGILLAHQIQTRFSDRNMMRDRGVKQAGFVVLKKASMPAILIEIGFLSNKDDEQKLINERSRSKIVSNISKGINEYIKSIQPIDNQIIAYIPPYSKPVSESKHISIDTKEQTVQFSVLLASSVNKEMKEYSDQIVLDKKILEERNEDGIYQYSIGPYASLTKAIKAQNSARESGYRGAYVIKIETELISRNDNPDILIKYAGVN